MKKVHAIKEFDRKDYGNHKTLCGGVTKMGEEYSMTPERVSCGICRNRLIDMIITPLISRININLKLIGMNDKKNSFIDELEKENMRKTEVIKYYESLR